MTAKRKRFAQRLLIGLQEAIEHAQGKRKLRVIEQPVLPQPKASKPVLKRRS